jgi:hypothetical protein
MNVHPADPITLLVYSPAKAGSAKGIVIAMGAMAMAGRVEENKVFPPHV